MVGIMVSNITYFGLYETLEPRNPTQIQQLLLNLFATITSGLVTYPIDTIRRRRMKTGEFPYEIIRRISRDYGMMGFYIGVSQSILKGFLDVCLDTLLKALKTKLTKKLEGRTVKPKECLVRHDI